MRVLILVAATCILASAAAAAQPTARAQHAGGLAMNYSLRQRWRQFSLQTLFVVTTACALLTGFVWPKIYSEFIQKPPETPWYIGENMEYYPPGPEFQLGREMEKMRSGSSDHSPQCCEIL